MGRVAGTLVLAGIAWMFAFASVAVASTFYVNSNADTTSATDECANVKSTDYKPSGPTDTCTLRDAIDTVTQADGSTPGPNTIAFITCGPFTVSGTALPNIPGDTTLDGTQAVNATCTDTGANNTGDAENYGYTNLEGSGAGPGGAAAFPGLVLDGSGSTVLGMIIGGFTDGIELAGSGDHHVYSSGIGANPFELGDLVPENSANGIEVMSGSANDVIGYAPTNGNNNYQDDIYGNSGWGVMLDPGSGPTTVGHNFIGTDTSGHEYGPGSEGYAGPPPGNAPLPGNGTSDGNGAGGVYVGDSSGDVIGGDVQCMSYLDTCNSNVISNNGGPGVEIAPAASGATVAGNYIGESLNFYATPLADGGAMANDGPGVLDEGTGDTIGGTDAGAANLISGNTGPGVELEGSDADLDGNLIGLGLTGTAASPNEQAGVLATDAGGVSTGDNRITGNTIGGNTGPGIQLDQAHNTIVSNFIGTAGDHTSPLANAIGILARTGPEQIGGVYEDPNTIAYNTGAGVAIVDPPKSSSYTSGVEVVDNSIFDNTGLGIDLGDDGVTQNHPLESTSGPNGWQNFPILTGASDANGQFSWHGTLDAAPNTYYAVYVFGSPTCDPSGYGQGQTLIDDGAVTTDANGHAAFVLTGQGNFSGMALSAVALGVNNSSSEFGPCITVGSGVDLTASQSVAGGGKVIAGDPVDVDIHVTNKGPGEATDIVLSDTVPQDVRLVSQPAGCPAPSGGQFSCSIGNLASGASEDVHVLLEPDDDAETLTNSVTVTADQVQSITGDNTSTFATAVTPNPNAPGVAEPSNEPAPSFGHYVLLNRQSGQVTATLPNGQVIQLRDFALVPVGTVVQTIAGVVQVTDALPGNSKKTTFAYFKYGRFRIAQARTKGGLLNAVMNGSLAGCSSSQLATSASGGGHTGSDPSGGASLASAARHRPTTRRLWGSDANNGNFTITGNRGAATVRGTIWEVKDTCTTTTVIVDKGVVDVTGFGHTEPGHATVTAGHRVVLRAG